MIVRHVVARCWVTGSVKMSPVTYLGMSFLMLLTIYLKWILQVWEIIKFIVRMFIRIDSNLSLYLEKWPCCLFQNAGGPVLVLLIHLLYGTTWQVGRQTCFNLIFLTRGGSRGGGGGGGLWGLKPLPFIFRLYLINMLSIIMKFCLSIITWSLIMQILIKPPYKHFSKALSVDLCQSLCNKDPDQHWRCTRSRYSNRAIS